MKALEVMTMTKLILLNKIKQVKEDAELKEIENGTILTLLDLLVDYVNDKHIREAIEEVPF